MHSIEELNKKIWYRLVKVLYIFAFTLVAGCTIAIAWADISHTSISNFDPTSLPGVTPVSFVPDKTSLDDLGFVPDRNQQPVHDTTPNNVANFLSEAVPALLAELILFETIRRGFYYVVTGKVFPRA